MSVAVRYMSRSGNTKLIADAIAEAAGVNAVSVTDAGAALGEKADVLFIGGALYAYGLDKNLKNYLAGIDASKVSKAVVFSTSSLTKHSIDLIKNGLAAKGIAVENEFFYCKGKNAKNSIEEAKSFAKKFL